MLNIVKASAGSGKTFLLAKTYIGLLLRSEDRCAYRHILAVTFTNKATDEMKSRIIKELDILARNPEESGYYKDFVREYGSAEKLKEKAENLLFDILHDYGSFSVSTIDRFFQTALKSFAREVGQFSTYQLELDKDSLVRESIDRMLDNLTEDNKPLLEWLKNSAMSQLEAGKKIDIAGDLFKTALSLKSDSHRELVEGNKIDEEKAYSKENLEQLRKTCRKYEGEFEKKVKMAAERVISVLEDAGIALSDTNGGFAKACLKYVSLKRGEISQPTDTFKKKALDSEMWFPKAKARKCMQMISGRQEEIAAAFADFVNLFSDSFKLYNTAVIIEDTLYNLGIASEFNDEFSALMKEKNVLNIDDSNTLLRKIIDGSDAPFVYEKLGVRYDSFLLDEFQDTSTIQWENFRPLVGESQARGADSLIVGDIKQSIYRWRGSDWNLLGSQVKESFPSADESLSLRDNWRSAPGIVEFNNAFFSYAAKTMDRLLENGDMSVEKIYSDVAQTPRLSGGSVIDVTFCDKEKELEETLRAVKEIVSEGKADYGQIAVIVRKNDTGSEVARYLISNGIPVISDDSLEIRSSVVVRRLVSLMYLVANPSDKVDGYLAAELGIGIPSDYMSLTGLAEGFLRELRKADPDAFDNEVLFIQSFMDCLQEWTSTGGNNLAAFLEYWEGQKGKISSPSDPDAVRIITVHKAKGLEFPYVVFPFAEKVQLSRSGEKWCCPQLSGTPLDSAGGVAYYVTMSSESADTYFGGDYLEDRKMQYIDNLNVMYVALTRACNGLYVISAQRSRNKDGKGKEQGMGDILYDFLDENRAKFKVEVDEDSVESFRQGTFAAFTHKKDSTTLEWPSSYPSFPLNNDEAGEGERSRLKLNSDSSDFFSGEKDARLKGIVLHGILSSVKTPSDLDAALESAVRRGDIPQENAQEYRDLLSERIAYGRGLGWFPDDPSKVDNELSLIDMDGNVYRPDRVVSTEAGKVIIDYKFGEENLRYLRQIEKYASLYREMGYGDVTACLWYVYENKIVYLRGDKN